MSVIQNKTKQQPPKDYRWLFKASSDKRLVGSLIEAPTKEAAIAQLLTMANLKELPEGTVVVLAPFFND